MRIMNLFCLAALTAAACLPASADTLTLKDGRVLKDVFVRDEGIRLLVWEKFEDVGGPSTVYPRSRVKEFKIERGDEWDKHPALPDLSVTFIEMNPKLAGLHGHVDYDNFGRPVLKGTGLPDLGARAIMHPEEVVKDVKLKYTAGEPITLTAHVKNLGFATAKPFTIVWYMDGKEVRRTKVGKSLKEMEETTDVFRWNWQESLHTVKVVAETKEPEIATINNEASDPLWGMAYYYVVHKGRVAAWHQYRTASGTFSFEDFYRWHVDLMNTLFAASIFPGAPQGIKARVRLDRIIYADDIDQALKTVNGPDGLGYHQGGWTWVDDDDKNKTWKPATKEWRNATEWSLPHELGHQLGVTDWYALDYDGSADHVWPDNGAKVSHFQNHPTQMMHWHGPQLYGEVDAGYLNQTWDKPRGYFGDYYFAIPKENFLRILDVNNQPVPGAKVEIYQRGAKVDVAGAAGTDQGVKYFPLVEDGNFDLPVSKDPVISGVTDQDGVLRLPNRPVQEVRSLNGYERKPNPFGNINVVGNRGDMLVKVSHGDRPAYFYLEIYDFNVAWHRGQKDRYVTTFKTPFGSVSSPLRPKSIAVTLPDQYTARVTWEAGDVVRETQYLDNVIGYRVYRRIGDMGLNDRPWFPVATLGPDARECVVDLRQKPDDVEWFTRTNRFAVSSIGALGLESELVETVVK